MATFKAVGPDGKAYTVDAPDAQAAGMALDEMMQAGGGQQPQGERVIPKTMPIRNAFSAGFDPTQDSAETAAGLDDRLHGVHGQDLWRGRVATGLNAAMMGYGDEIMATVGGGLEFAKGGNFQDGYDFTLNDFRDTRRRYEEARPVESAVVDIGASIPTALVPGGAALRGASLGSKVVRGTAAGAGYGAVRGFGEGEDGAENRAVSGGIGALTGGAVGAAAPAAGRALGKGYAAIRGKAAPPSAADIGAQAAGLFQRAEQSGVQFKPQALQGLSVIAPRMQGGNRALPRLRPEIHPQTLGALQVVDDVSRQQSITFADVMTTRQVLRDFVESAKPGSPDEREAIRVLEAFDKWSDALKPRDLVAGNVTGREAFQMYGDARRLWTIKKKADEFERIVRNAELERGKAGGFEAALKSGFKSLAKKQWAMRSFTAGEQAAIREVARGGPARWFMQALEEVMPDRDMKGLMMGAGWGAAGTALGPAGTIALPAAATAAGVGLRSGIRSSVRKSADRADAMVRSGAGAPISTQAADAVADYATRLLSAGGQPGASALAGEINPRRVLNGASR